MKNLQCLFITLLVCFYGVAQKDSNLTEEIMSSALLLESKLQGNKKITGTGVLLMDSIQTLGFMYIATAKHVIGENGKGKTFILKNPIWKVTYSDNLYSNKTGSFLINLQKL